MKITKSQLKQIIKEELQTIVKEGHGLEGKMAQGQLRRIGELANMIADQFDDGSNLEEWVEAKITKSQDYLSSVMNYMRGQSFPKARAVNTIKGDFPELSEAVTPLGEVQSDALTQQIAYDERQKELEKAKKLKARSKEAETGLSALTPAEVADEILAKRAKPKIKFPKGGVMVSGVPVAKFGESLEKIVKEEVKSVLSEQEFYEVEAKDINEEYCPVCQEAQLEEKKKRKKKRKKACKPSKGKRFAKRVDGKCRSFGQKGQAKGGGDRIRPGTKKGDAYCARSAGIKKCKNPPCANTLSRRKWKCRGKKSVAEE